MRRRRTCEADVANAWAPNLRSRSGKCVGAEPAKQTSQMRGRRTCEAGGSIKPGAQAPGAAIKKGVGARKTGDSPWVKSAVERFAGSGARFNNAFLGLAPRLYATTSFA